MNVTALVPRTDFLTNPHGMRPVDQARIYMDGAISEFVRRRTQSFSTSFERNLEGVLIGMRRSNHQPELALIPRIDAAKQAAVDLWRSTDASSAAAVADAARGAAALFTPILADLPPAMF